MKKVNFILGLLCLAACESEGVPEPAADCLVAASAHSGEVIEGEYIITLKENAETSVLSSTATNARIAAFSEQLLTKYHLPTGAVRTAFGGKRRGFVAKLSETDVKTLQSAQSVELVEPDRKVSICGCVDVVAPSSVTWSTRKTGYGNGKNFEDKTVWIIDTGVDLDHPDLNVDTQRSQSFITGQTSADDNNGHGTHVAGIIGALNNTIGIVGVASGVKLVALKALDQVGEGRLSSVVAAVSYVSQNGKAGDVVNMSLGLDGISTTLDRQVQAAADKGILFAIAAGNDKKSANTSSPGRVNHANVFTVSAIDSMGRFADFSNYGNDAVDVAAYGVRILSTYANGRYAILSGTSMAAPHVAGLLLIRGRALPTFGTAANDPDGTPDPIARVSIQVAAVSNLRVRLQ
ncbi:S8 family serine peptidase [Runella slithyformis]|uniref:Aqualysin 1 n=1 Tax=Runella slithyformis (strain ATCC 29530 / DSM 19594 / LMG 11500 / NCIMB 11436 / LSU 4) TaxID=761193 RepID=A0A7U4E4Q6_RUNSL|nr:S8 family serine peptidase [Runella slithyformis]AEI47529.1 Aqualysin 1 [Runella slithyformis DSM 19594]